MIHIYMKDLQLILLCGMKGVLYYRKIIIKDIYIGIAYTNLLFYKRWNARLMTLEINHGYQKSHPQLHAMLQEQTTRIHIKLRLMRELA